MLDFQRVKSQYIEQHIDLVEEVESNQEDMNKQTMILFNLITEKQEVDKKRAYYAD